MSRLFLLRHAKAAWAKPGERDFDRPLQYSGETDSRTTGAEMAAKGLIPATVLCSTARRARETWLGVSQELGIAADDAIYLGELYSTDGAGYLKLVRAAAPADTMLVIGHNPMMEDLAEALSGKADPAARAALEAGFPTAGLAVISFAGPLSEAAPGGGHLEQFLAR